MIRQFIKEILVWMIMWVLHIITALVLIGPIMIVVYLLASKTTITVMTIIVLVITLLTSLGAADI